MKWGFGRIVLCLQILLNHRLAYGFLRSFRIGLWLRKFSEGFIVIWSIKVGAMFPHIACHVVEAIGVWGEGLDRCSSRESIFGCILVREFPLIDIGLPFIPGLGFIAPAVTGPVFLAVKDNCAKHCVVISTCLSCR